MGGQQLVWGLLGRETLKKERRARTLGVSASVRLFNELAVPGMGNVWYGKQLFLATLGVFIAEKSRRERKPPGSNYTNIKVSNALEALANGFSFEGQKRVGARQLKGDLRLRGRVKLSGKFSNRNSKNLSFSNVTKPSFYVTQPMRMQTVQALPALGLVSSSGERYNSFRSTTLGCAFIRSVLGSHHDKVIMKLTKWVCGNGKIGDLKDEEIGLLSPLREMNESSIETLQGAMIGDSNSMDASRRKAALEWVEEIRNNRERELVWKKRPSFIDEEHWADMHTGALFFGTKNVALCVLDEVERQMKPTSEIKFKLSTACQDNRVRKRMKSLRDSAQEFLDKLAESPNSVGFDRNEATSFANECVAEMDLDLLKNLLKRDDRVLCLEGEFVTPGGAFGSGKEREAGEADISEDVVEGEIRWPANISHRVENLFLMNVDLKGGLDNELALLQHQGSGDT